MSLEHPNYRDFQDRQLYDKIFYHDIGRELTTQEKNFCKAMYHMEEYTCGLDGTYDDEED